MLELQIYLSANILCKWQKYEDKNLHTMAMAPFAKYSAKVTRHLHVFCCFRALLTSWSHTVKLIWQEYYDNIPIQTELLSTSIFLQHSAKYFTTVHCINEGTRVCHNWRKLLSPCIKPNTLTHSIMSPNCNHW